MKLIIGRDEHTSQLKVNNGTQEKLYGAAGSVPMNVSRKHCELSTTDNKTFIITNINAANVTWVNGIQVQSKQIALTDKIELGPSHYQIPLQLILQDSRPTDISELKKVWIDYENSLLEIKRRQKINNLLSRVPIVFTLLGGLVSAISEDIRPFSVVLTVIALLIMLYGFYRIWTDKSEEELKDIKKKFQQDYVCPKCKRFLSFIDYDILNQYTNCPHCKTPYK